MPAAPVTSISANREGVYVILEAHLPESLPRNVGVLLMDPSADRGWLRMLPRFDEIAAPEDAEVLGEIEADLRSRLAAQGAQALLASLEDSLSNTLRISERHRAQVDAFTRVLDRLYGEQVEETPVEPFGTHVPLYTLRAAAGYLGEEMPSEPEDWVRIPEGMRADRAVFAAHVVGRSMEPLIPDGSLNLFRLHPAGSRQNKILLIQRFGLLDETARYTVKRYTSKKSYSGEGEWRHEQIRLEPLNPEFEAWDVGPEDFAVVAEWLRVLE